ncbi:MAG: transporter substrate-binding domain-containing protein [Desulfobacteraceae bacterium]
MLSGAEINYPPFSIVDEDGKANGFSVELMQAALKAMGRNVTFRTGEWIKVKEWLEKGEIQALPLVGRTPERESVYDFTFPYMTLHGAIVVRKGETGIQRLEDLKGRQVAVMEGDNAEEFLLRENRGIDLRSIPTFKKALLELSEGRHDAVFIQRIVALRLIRENKISNLEVINNPVHSFKQEFCFAVQEGDRETLSLLNEGLSLVMADGTFRRLHAKWFAAPELSGNNRIVIGGDENYPPYEYLDENGLASGFNVEITRALARELGLEVEIRLGPWTEIRKALETGKIDAVQGMLYSAERDLLFDFTQNYTVNHYVGIVRSKEGEPPVSAADLHGKRIVVQKGDIMHDFCLEQDLEKQLTTVSTQEDALRQLAEGEHDCALAARLTALYWIEKHGWDNLVLAHRPVLSPEYGYAVRNSQKALAAQLSEGLKLLDETGEYRRIYKKWLDIYKEPDFNLAWFLKYTMLIIIPLLVLVCGFFLWSWSLRRQVRERTEELRKSENMLQRVFEILPIGLWFTDKSGTPVRANPAGCRIWNCDPGMNPEKYSAYTARRLPAGEEIRPFGGDLNRTVKYGAAVNDELLEIETIEGGRKTILNYSAPVLNSTGEIEAAVIVNLDVTDLIRTEKALITSEVRNRTLVDTIPDLIWLKDENGVYLSCNPTFEKFFGAKEPEIKGKTDYDFVDESTADSFRMHDRKAMQAGQPMINEEHLTFAKDGYQGIFETIKTPMPDNRGNLIGILGIARDITDRKKAEKENLLLERKLSQAQKLETIGTLAGGIAHDFNNILTSIIGFTQLCLADAKEGTDLHNDLSQVMKAGLRAKDLVQQILAISRKDEKKIIPVSINPLIKEALKMLRSTLPSSIELRINIPSEPFVVQADPTKIHQVIMNLATNAMHAMADSAGVIEVTVCTKSLDENIKTAHPGMEPGEYVQITVSDTGNGIPEQFIDKIFEPYFTTKRKGRGTGLGLSVVHGIIKSHGGHITVYSEPGKGTTFHIYLPRTLEKSRDPEKLNHDPVPGGTEHILLIDDEPQIVKLHQRVLEKLGYTVTAHTASSEALESFKKEPESFDLIVTDMTMPNMNGDKIAGAIKEIRPGIPVLLCTGHNHNIMGKNPMFDAIVIKPVDKALFAETVRNLLDQ